MTTRLQSMLEEAKRLRDEAVESAARTGSVAHQLSAQTLQQHVDELEQSVRIERDVDARDLVELRLIGTQVEDGTVPLSTFGKITKHLHDALANAAHYAVKGVDVTRLPAQIEDLLNLRLAGLAHGSSRVFIRGDASPDLTGESVLQTALRNSFSLLTLSGESLHESVNALGVKAVRQFAGLLDELHKEHIAAELLWFAPDATRFEWRATIDQVTRLRNELLSVDEPTVSREELEGEVLLLSQTGRVQIRLLSGAKVSMAYSRDVFDRVRRLSLGMFATFVVDKKTFRDRVADRDVANYSLRDVILGDERFLLRDQNS